MNLIIINIDTQLHNSALFTNFISSKVRSIACSLSTALSTTFYVTINQGFFSHCKLISAILNIKYNTYFLSFGKIYVDIAEMLMISVWLLVGAAGVATGVDATTLWRCCRR